MSEKTERPTARRIRDARRRGDVPISRELTSTASFAGLLAFLVALAPAAWDRMHRLFEHLLWRAAAHTAAETGGDVMLAAVLAAVPDIMVLVLVPALAAAIAAIAGGFAQARGVFSFETVKPNFARLNPVEGMRRYFSTRTLIDLGKNMLKLVVVAALLYGAIRGLLAPLLHLMLASPLQSAQALAQTFVQLFTGAGLLFVAFAMLDVIHQRHEFEKRLRMSKDEIRREHKEDQGDPHIRGARRTLSRELAMSPVAESTKPALP